MRYSTQIKPVSYVKANMAALLDRINEEREPIIITQNGEAKAAFVDIKSYEEQQETLAMLQILAIGEKQVAAGEVYPFDEVVNEIRNSRRTPGSKSARVSPGHKAGK